MKKLTATFRTLAYLFNEDIIEVIDESKRKGNDFIEITMSELPKTTLSKIELMITGWKFFLIDSSNDRILLFK